MPVSDDLRDSYQAQQREQQSRSNEAVLDSLVFGNEYQKTLPSDRREIPNQITFGRRKTDDPIGRPAPAPEQKSAIGKVLHNAAEVPEGVVKGVHDAVYNATAFVEPLADWLDENVAHLGNYQLEQPETIVGGITKSISQFLTGFLPSMKMLKSAGFMAKAGKVGEFATAPLAGAISDFATRDPHEGRLADLWLQAGLSPNTLTDFLKSEPDDTTMDARFKNAIESAGFGALTDGVMLGARAIRAAKKVAKVSKTEIAILKDKYGELSDDEIRRVVGDPSLPVIETRKVHTPKTPGKMQKGMEQTAAFEPRSVIRAQGRKGVKQTAPGSEDFETYINFARIDEPDQIKFVIGKMAEANKAAIDEARRGVITQETTQKLADDLGLTVTELLERRKGQAFNAEEALAARQLWGASAEKLLDAAKKAAAPNAGPLDQYAFRKMMAVHAAVQNEVIGVRTETARALASWKIPAGGSIEKARAIEQMTKAMGGPDVSREMARRLAILAEFGGDPGAIARFVERGYGEATLDAVKEVWVNGLLSSPKTHVVNTMSNTLVLFQQMYERAAAAQIGKVAGTGGVEPGEATAMLFGLVQAQKDAWRMAAKSFHTGQTGYAFNKIDVTHPNALSSEAFRMSNETGAGKFVDFIGHAAAVPGRLLGAEDEFFKTIGYRMEVNAQALRAAKQEGLSGDALKTRVAELINNPPEHIRINSADAAMYNTFTNELGSFGTAIMNMRNVDSPISLPLTFILPFVRTPANIARYSFERTPFAPLVGQWRADIAAGGARASLALARMATGTSIMLMAMDWAQNGLISGHGPTGDDVTVREALQRQGWQPYSVKIGDRWVSYNRTDPFGMALGFAASITEAVQKGELDEEDVDEWNEVAAMAIASVSQVTINKTYLEGFSNFVEVMNDPKRHSEKYVDNLVASFVPFTALMGTIKNVDDPVLREIGTPQEAIEARIIGLSEKLPPRRNLWGEKLTYESGLGRVYDAVTPLASKPQEPTPVDREIVRLGRGPERISKKASFGGVRVNFKQWPEAYDEYVRLAGNDLKHPAWGAGAKDYLNAVINNKHPMSAVYKILSDEQRKEFIVSAVSDYRKLAQYQMMNDPKFVAFASYVNGLKDAKMRNKLPVFSEE